MEPLSTGAAAFILCYPGDFPLQLQIRPQKVKAELAAKAPNVQAEGHFLVFPYPHSHHRLEPDETFVMAGKQVLPLYWKNKLVLDPSLDLGTVDASLTPLDDSAVPSLVTLLPTYSRAHMATLKAALARAPGAQTDGSKPQTQ